MAQNKLRFFGILLGILMVIGMQGCGGGGGQDGSANGGGVFSGIAVDPYIAGAIFEEVPAVGGAPLQESSPSDAQGRFAFGKPLTPGSLVQMKAGQQGRHNGIPFAGVLKRVVDSQGELVVSPMTTLLANGLSADDVIALLGEAGLAGITHDDLMADPMAGLDGALPLPGQALRRLQAAMAVNAFFSLANGYEMSAAEVQANKNHLAEMVAMVGTVLGPEQFDQMMPGITGDLDPSRRRAVQSLHPGGGCRNR